VRQVGFQTEYVKDIVYFDLETQKSADEVGGWGKISRMGMSIGVTYSATGGYRIYAEVLHGYTPFDMRQLPTLDMIVELQNTLQHRLSLDSIATATFGAEKTADGMQAIRWFKDGKLMEIAEYCCYDVKLTRLVHEYGLKHRQLHYLNRFGKKMTVPVAW
jgi:hypothetical protein